MEITVGLENCTKWFLNVQFHQANWNKKNLIIFSIHILTWNVSTKYPEHLPVHLLLGLEKNADNDHHRPDIFVIG